MCEEDNHDNTGEQKQYTFFFLKKKKEDIKTKRPYNWTLQVHVAVN